MVAQLQFQIQSLKSENQAINLKLQNTTTKEKELTNKLSSIEGAIEDANTTNGHIITTMQDLKQDLKQTMERNNNEITFKIDSKFQIIQDAIYSSMTKLTKQKNINITQKEQFVDTITNNENNEVNLI